MISKIPYQITLFLTKGGAMKHIDQWELVPTKDKTWSIKGLLNGQPWMTSTVTGYGNGKISTLNSVYSLGACSMGAGKRLAAILRDSNVTKMLEDF